MNVAVLGADSRGRDIALLCARAGHAVSLFDDEATRVMDRIDEIEHNLVDRAASGQISLEQKSNALAGLDGTTALRAAVSDAAVVIETREQETEAIQATFADIEDAVDRETLITVSTDQSVTPAAAGLRQPDRAFGFRFPDVADPTVVELLVATQTTAATTERAESFLESLGVTPVRVVDVPGTASTRLELALEVEAMRAVADEVVSVTGIDALWESTHQTMGPLERADRAGLESRLETLQSLAETVGDRFEPPELLAELVADGQTGTSVGRGFYVWESGEPVRSALDEPPIPQRSDQPDDPTGQ